MEGGERKEDDGSLPPEYVSLAKLQERWLLRKQEERELKQEQEEKEEADKRERGARAPPARATAEIEDKGKEIVGGGGGPRTGGEIIKKRKNHGKKGKRKFKGASAVEVKEKAGVQAEEVGYVSVVEVFLPTNGEITHLKRTSLKNDGRNRDGASRRMNELKQSEVALDLEEGEHDLGLKLRGRGREKQRGRNGGRVNNLKQSEVALGLEKEKEKEGENDHGVKWRERGGEREGGRDRGEDKGRIGGRVNSLKQSAVALDLEKKKEKGESDHGMKLGERGRERGRGRDSGEDKGRIGGRVNNLKQSEVALDLEENKEKGENDHGMKLGERVKGREGERGREKGLERGRNGDYPERRMNRKKYRPVVLVDQVESHLKNQAEDGISEVCSEINSLNIGLRGTDNNAKEDGVEGELLNGDKGAVKIEKKVNNEVLARKGGNLWMGYRTDGNPRGGLGRRYRTNGNPGQRYGRGRGYTRAHISDRMNFTEIVKVWVKKEDKLDA